MSDDKLLNFMANHIKGATNEEDVKNMIVSNNIQPKIKEDIVLDIINYEGNTYYKDQFNNILDQNTQVIGLVEVLNNEYKYHFNDTNNQNELENTKTKLDIMRNDRTL
jgi:hypothetical protein